MRKKHYTIKVLNPRTKRKDLYGILCSVKEDVEVAKARWIKKNPKTEFIFTVENKMERACQVCKSELST